MSGFSELRTLTKEKSICSISLVLLQNNGGNIVQNQFDICIIGSGPAGIFTAMGLVDRYNVLVLEFGNKFSDRQCCRVIDDDNNCRGCDGKCSIITGFGGSFCSKSGGTLSLYPAGSSLVEYYDTQENLLADYNRAIKIWKNYSEDNMSYEGSTDKEKIISFSKKVNDFGGTYKHYNGFKLNKSNLDKTIQRMEDFISSNAKLEFNSEVISVKKEGELWQIKCRNGNLYTSKLVVFATGRKGNSFTSRKLKKLGVNYKKTGIDLGVRLELSKDKIDDLSELHPDIKIKFDINGEEVRTFCFCPKGRLIHFNQDSLCSAKSMNFLEGCIDDNNLSDRTNIAFLHRINFNTTDEVFEFQRNFEEKYYSLGGKVISQRFKDVGKQIFSPLPFNTTLKKGLFYWKYIFVAS